MNIVLKKPKCTDQTWEGRADCVQLARLLLSLGNPGNGYCFNHIGREDIASILGITTETASRIMADLRRRNIINCASGAPCNCKPDQLRLIAENTH